MEDTLIGEPFVTSLRGKIPVRSLAHSLAQVSRETG